MAKRRVSSVSMQPIGAFEVSEREVGWGALVATVVAVGLPLSLYTLWQAAHRTAPAGQAKGVSPTPIEDPRTAFDEKMAAPSPFAKRTPLMAVAFAQAAPIDPCASLRTALGEATRALATTSLSTRGFNGSGPATYLGTALQWSTLSADDRFRWLANAFRFHGTAAAFSLVAPEWTRQLRAELARLDGVVAALLALRSQNETLLRLSGCAL